MFLKPPSEAVPNLIALALERTLQSVTSIFSQADTGSPDFKQMPSSAALILQFLTFNVFTIYDINAIIIPESCALHIDTVYQ